jgi:ABC-type oligopeptide transport system substrate-binding subunit
LTDPAFIDVEVRRALSLAIDRKALADDVVEGGVAPATRLLGPGFARAGDVTCAYCTFDPDRARELWPDDPPEPLNLWFAADAGHEPVMRAIAEGWQEELGAEGIQFASLAQGPFIDRITNNDVDGPFRLSWQADVAAPVRVIEPLLGPRGAANDVRFRSEALADLLAVAGGERDVQQSLIAYGSAEQLVLEEMPIIPLWFSTIPVASRPDVTGIALDGEGRLEWTRLGG